MTCEVSETWADGGEGKVARECPKQRTKKGKLGCVVRIEDKRSSTGVVVNLMPHSEGLIR